MNLPTYLQRWPTRPLSNAHWSLLVAVLGIWAFAILGQPCKEPPYYFEVSLATVTLCIALWAADLRKDALARWKRIPRVLTLAFYDLCSSFLLLILLIMPIAIFIPAYQCYTPRAKVSEVILAGVSFRQTIAERAEKQKSLKGTGIGLEIQSVGRVESGYITPDGDIFIASNDPPAIVVLHPSMDSGTVKWSCGGLPRKLMPSSCSELWGKGLSATP